ncbi:MAG: N-acetylneuraminate synthase [Sporocytophaga sp.]|uniref:N-acetylneuraminate synthase n=1 Tax=Sporocytophaga sp. TaxID=2231183 RepID=UPI001B0E7D65|nr:N-acetylneuraminate synthase [Sporocytophaga sp.]MBO9700877.1 N-acetylneuraminate synthase [Sporocytophaga sp.]
MKQTILIIAEAGVNHNGSIDIAKKLIDKAFEAGADIIKFQTFKASTITSKKSEKAEYQKKMTGADEGQYEMLKRLELNETHHHILKEYCETKPIEFLSTPFDLQSIDLLKDLGINIGKIPSGELTNLPYLRKMAKNFEKIILSTGMANLEEVKTSVKVLLSSGLKKENLTILHCTTEYPTPMKDVNLKAMLTIQKELNVAIGYSDHTNGIEIPIAATALGATVIEKHFTLDRNMEGPDHQSSLEPDELKAMVAAIRNIEIALGDGIKTPSESEKKNIGIARKSIHILNNLPVGHILTENDLIMKRPGDGISPMEMDKVVGKKLLKSMSEDDKLNWKDIA